MNYAPLSRADYDAVCTRLETAATALYAAGSFIQAVARWYYVVYHTGCYLGRQTGMSVRHQYEGPRARASTSFRHVEVPDIVVALYTGNKSYATCVADIGSTPGIANGIVAERDVWKKVEGLRLKRIAADYQGGAIELIDRSEADDLISDANALVQDLRRILT